MTSHSKFSNSYSGLTALLEFGNSSEAKFRSHIPLCPPDTDHLQNTQPLCCLPRLEAGCITPFFHICVLDHVYVCVLRALLNNGFICHINYYYGSTALYWALAVFSVFWSYIQFVGLLGRGISPSHVRYLHTGRTERINAYIHALNGIRTHGPSVRVSDDSSCLRPRGHCDRLYFIMQSVADVYK
jgi:hypothetical protein